jgi:antitoxin MazE
MLYQEAKMRTAVRRLGNSSGVIIPKSLLAQIGLEVGGSLDMTLEEGRIVLAPIKRRPREGWADASQKLAEAGEDALIWPEFGNDDDETLVW